MKSRKKKSKFGPSLRLVGPEPARSSAKPDAPVLDEWRELYAAAARFKELQPWNRVYDSDLFGVKDPETGVVGYCSVMGRLGEHFALAAYLGSRGLAGLLRVFSGAKPNSLAEWCELQECVMVSFEDRELLLPQDREVMRRLGLGFRGRNAWPLFRRYRRGCFPWFINRWEARFLTTVLDQAIDVVSRAAEDETLLEPADRTHLRCLVRVPEGLAESRVWRDEWLMPEPMTPEEFAAEKGIVPLAEGYVEELEGSVTGRCGTWELEVSCYGEPMQDEPDAQPYYAWQFLVADNETGFVFKPDLCKADEHVPRFRAVFASIVKEHGVLPERIVIGDDASENVMAPVCCALNIALERGQMPTIRRFRREMAKVLKR